MAKYQKLVDDIRQHIARGIWLPGDKLPSLREQAALSGMSLMTVMHAYQVLESLGALVSRPRQASTLHHRQSFCVSPQRARRFNWRSR